MQSLYQPVEIGLLDRRDRHQQRVELRLLAREQRVRRRGRASARSSAAARAWPVEAVLVRIGLPVAERVAGDRAGDQRRRPAGLGKCLGDDAAFRARGPHRVDIAGIGGERLQDDGLGDVGGPVAVDRAHDLEAGLFLQRAICAFLFLHDDRVAGDAFDHQDVGLAALGRGNRLDHVVAPGAVIAVDVDGVGAGDGASRRDERDAGVIGGLRPRRRAPWPSRGSR